MSKTTVYIEQDEWWPWHNFCPKRYGRAVKVDRETAERWERGLKAALELQREMAEAYDAASDEPDDGVTPRAIDLTP